jgi:hypothetical protein
MIHVVNDRSDLKHNIDVLEQYCNSSNQTEMKFYLGLIKRGTCFIIYEKRGEIKFAPSRFTGYKSNEIKLHEHNNNRDGRVTNKAIQKILGDRPKPNISAEYCYSVYCKNIGIEVKPFGTFGAPRKYWFMTEELKQEVLGKYSEAEKEKIDTDEINEDEKDTVRQSLIKARKGQGQYRDDLISIWKECPITKCDVLFILRASHIKPWRYSTNVERLDKYNGILLSPTYDALFDRGLISFSDSGVILISPKMNKGNIQKLNIDINAKIKVNEKSRDYIKFHRENIFEK